jgi:hypothetical protein
MNEKINKIKFTILGIVFLFLPLLATPIAFSGDAQAATNCTNSTTFLGIPGWYEYLQVTDDGTGNGCQVNAPAGSNKAVLIALAAIDILLRFSSLVALIFVVYGGFRFATAQGSPDAISKGKKTVVNALVGLVIAVLASQIVKFAAYLLSK